MKFRFSVCLIFAALCLVGAIPQSYAQDISPTVPVPPAYAIGQRLKAESEAASVEAHRLYGLNDSNAVYVHEIAHRRAYSAHMAFKAVADSKTYGRSPYAGEALYYDGQILAYYLYRKAEAVQAYKTIRDKYSDVQFPHKKLALAQLPVLESQADYYNKTHAPEKYFYGIMDFLVALTGRKTYSYFLAILMVSILVKLGLTPLTRQQYASMKEQQRLQPLVKEIQGKYKDDKQLQGQKIMDLYKEHKINPAAGCVPLLAQMPIIWGLYYMIRVYEFQFAHGTFLWIGSPLAHLYPSVFGMDLSQPDIPILLLYAGSMYVQQRMMVPPDPQQAEQARMMAIMTPFMTTYFFLQSHWPSAFVVYYFIFNILSTGQQYYYMKHRNKGDIPASGATVMLQAADGIKSSHQNGAKPKSSTNETSLEVPKVHPKKKR